MNERIKAIGRQAGFAFIEDGIYGQRWYSSKCGMDASEFEKFAQLIVAECVNRVTSKANGWGDMTGFAIKESILDCANDLKQHFGVEE